MNISDLPAGLKELAEKRRQEYLSKCKQNISSDRIFSAFVWIDTKEGYNFWDNIGSGNFEEWFEIQRKYLEFKEKEIYNFGSWLAEYCTIKDGIFQYYGEDYSLEGIIGVYKTATQV